MGSWSGNDAAQAGRRDSGFTLLELIIVCALIGLLMVVSVPAFRDALLNDPLKSGGRKMIGYIQGVREKSVREHQPYLIFFDLDENRVYHMPEAEAGEEIRGFAGKNILQLPGNVEITDVWSKGRGTVDRGVTELWVSRQGYLDRSVIHLEEKGGKAISLVLETFLPRIEVKDDYFEPE